MVKLLLSLAAASLQTALKCAAGLPGWLNKKMELHLHHVKNGPMDWSSAKCVMAARVMELGRLRELTWKARSPPQYP